MTKLSYEVIQALKGRTLATAESCTGGAIGAALTDVPGSSAVFKGGIISYTNAVKSALLDVDENVLNAHGAVSAKVAGLMAIGAKDRLNTDYAISVTGLAGPDADDFGNSVGTVFIGFCDDSRCVVKEYHFPGERHDVRQQAVDAALKLILTQI